MITDHATSSTLCEVSDKEVKSEKVAGHADLFFLHLYYRPFLTSLLPPYPEEARTGNCSAATSSSQGPPGRMHACVQATSPARSIRSMAVPQATRRHQTHAVSQRHALLLLKSSPPLTGHCSPLLDLSRPSIKTFPHLFTVPSPCFLTFYHDLPEPINPPRAPNPEPMHPKQSITNPLS